METKLSRLGIQPFISRRRRSEQRATRAQLLVPIAFVLGNAAMYYLDPLRGASRRAVVRAKSVHSMHGAQVFTRKGVRDLRHRGRGIIARIAALFRSRQDVPDSVLQARVRSRLGHAMPNPRAVEVTVRDGRVALHGTVPPAGMTHIVGVVRSVPGVEAIDNQLTIASQAGMARGEQRQQKTWSPGVRLLIGAVGSGLIAAGVQQRGRLGRILAAAGAIILLRDYTNAPVRALTAGGKARRAIELQKTITINAPLETVFGYWADPDNLPKIMSHIRSVTRIDDGLYRWTVAAPAGLSVSWHAEVTYFVPNELIAWASLPGEVIENAGTLRFDRNPDGSTRLDVKMSYTPPGGVIGHAIASMFGADPKHAMDDDLVRFKSLLEDGKTRVHGHKVTREDIEMAH